MTDRPYNSLPANRVSPYIKWRRNLIIIIPLFFLIIIICVAGYELWHNNIYNATIALTYAPTSATATINNQPVQAGNTQVKPGTYTVVIKKTGFTTSTSTIVANKGQTATVKVALQSNSAATANWYSNNPADQTINEAVGASTAEASEDQLQKTFPIANILPLTGPTYEVDYGASPDKKGQFALTITYYTDTGKQDAANALQTLGYNIDNYETFYINGAQ